MTRWRAIARRGRDYSASWASIRPVQAGVAPALAGLERMPIRRWRMACWRHAAVIFLLRQIGDIEHVDRLLAEGGDVRRGDVETQVGDGAGHLVEQAGTVAGRTTSITVKWSDTALSMMTSGSTVNAPSRPLGLMPLCHQVRQAHLALAAASRSCRRCVCATALVVVLVELAVEQEGVESKSVARRGDVGADDVGTGRGAGAGEQRQQSRMVGGEQRTAR